jgi:hypothetical protein
MGSIGGTIRRHGETRLKSAPIETTLYDLIGAVQDALPREDEKMVTWVVWYLLNRGIAKFQSPPGAFPQNYGLGGIRPS